MKSYASAKVRLGDPEFGFQGNPMFSNLEALGLQDLLGFLRFQCRTCSTSLPGGNLVDGLPPVAHTGEGRIGSAPKNN